jgi:hypothetical protein
MVGVADALPVVVIGEVTSPRSDSEEVRVCSLLEVLEAESVMVGVWSFVADVVRGPSVVVAASLFSWRM